jgi:hypothetical protein
MGRPRMRRKRFPSLWWAMVSDPVELGSLRALVDVIVATATNTVLAIKQLITTVPIYLRKEPNKRT